MSPRVADRAVRRLVAELASVRESDVRLILSELSDGQRDRVRVLLASYGGAPDQSAPPAVPKAPEMNMEGLSPWLAARIGYGVQSPRISRPRSFWLGRFEGPRFEFRMTPRAQESLRSCIRAIQGPVPARRRTWAGRAIEFVVNAVARR